MLSNDELYILINKLMFVKCFEREKDNISISANYYYAAFFALAVPKEIPEVT